MKKIRAAILQIENKPSLKGKWVLLLVMLLFIPHLYISYAWYLQTTMPDLYMKIIGSRLFSHNINPFVYVWQPGDPATFFNPNYFEANGLNGVTVTPFFLWLQIPLSKLIFCDAKLAWWICMEAFFFLSVFVSLLIPKDLLKQIFVGGIIVCFFAFSRNWWLHIYNGQYYVLFAFVFCLSAYWTTKNKKQNWELLLYPVVSLIRPFFIFSIIPWLLINTKKKIKNILSGCLFAVAFFLLAGHFSSWGDYHVAMKAYAGDNIQLTQNKTFTDPRNYDVPLEPCVIRVDHFPATKAGGLFGLQHYLQLFGISIISSWMYSLMLVICIALFLVILYKKADIQNPEILFLASFTIYIFCEIFTPAPRNPYNLIQYLGVIGILVNRSAYKIILLAIIGLALNHDFPFRMNYQREFGELLLLLSILLSTFQRERKIKIAG